jgi:hypothetical protein
MIESPKKPKAVKWVIIFTMVAIFIGTGWIVLFSWQAKGIAEWFSIMGVSAILGGAFFVSGLLLGFIFGVAKPQEAGKPNKQDGTNLEQISEWLTKIIVGAGLAQLAMLPGSLKEFGKYAKEIFGCLAYVEIFAIGILIYYTSCGLLCGYLLTKLYFLGLMEDVSDRGEKGEQK